MVILRFFKSEYFKRFRRGRTSGTPMRPSAFISICSFCVLCALLIPVAYGAVLPVSAAEGCASEYGHVRVYDEEKAVFSDLSLEASLHIETVDGDSGDTTGAAAGNTTGEADLPIGYRTLHGRSYTVLPDGTIRTVRDMVSSLRSGKLLLYPGGIPFGVRFLTEGVMVVGFCDLTVGGKAINPAKDAGLQLKDVILSVNGQELSDAGALTDLIRTCGGAPLTLLCRREGKEITLVLCPQKSDADGQYKTGIWVRDGGAGIGTVTYVVPEDNSFAGLGHGICDADTGEPVALRRGSVSDVVISGVVRGQVGAPGEIKGYFTSGKTGTLLTNTECGVFGVFTALPDGLPDGPIPAACREEVVEGDAFIFCTLDTGKVERYAVKVSNVNRAATGPKCFTVHVVDPLLIERSGGIVQGMSGSPIIQNGKLIGAVTHVLINDPTVGYGIFLENMLAAMKE